MKIMGIIQHVHVKRNVICKSRYMTNVLIRLKTNEKQTIILIKCTQAKNNVWQETPTPTYILIVLMINVREHKSSDQEWTIKRHGQHWAYKTFDEDKQPKTNK